MTLRTILIVLSLLVMMSTAVGGQLYYSSLRDSAYNEARRQAASDAEVIKSRLSSFLAENLRPVRTLAGLTAIRRALTEPDADNLTTAFRLLTHFRETLGVDVCYLMDRTGLTIESSNRDATDSFVGRNFGFRPYFQQAMDGHPTVYMALGTRSLKRGAYFSHQVKAPGEGSRPIGVVVIKAAIDVMESTIIQASDGIVTLSDPNGVVFATNRPEWLYHTLWEMTPGQAGAVGATRQFGPGPWPWLGLEVKDWEHAVDRRGDEYLIHQMDIASFPGWQVTYLRDVKAISRTVFDPLVKTTGSVILAMCILIGFSVYYLYRRANYDIVRRKVAEEELRQSEERYRGLYHNTPALLHSIDAKGRLVSVSDHWAEALGYPRQEVIGRRLTDFLTEESRIRAEEKVFPEFFDKGYCKDVPYRFIRSDGSRIDVLLSAIADRDHRGEIMRSLAVLVDITERKRAEEALRQAQEKLSRYSRDLERQVQARTREITSILEYTPAVVHIKDATGRYVLVNSRFEELFGVSADRIAGLTDDEVLPPEVADQYRAGDRRLMEEGRSFQIEERLPHDEGVHSYLTVRFAIRDPGGEVTRLCGISLDITDLKEAQDQLRRLSGSILVRQEQERAIIARELHDQLGQVLTALRMDAVWLRSRLSDTDPPAAERALMICDMVDDTISDIRSIATRLRPAVLDDLGLVEALEWFTNDFERRTVISCVFAHHGVGLVGEAIATATYRIAQEALTNVARHARASRVEVDLRGGGARLRLTVKDDGQGFDPEALDEFQALGVAGMKERAGLVGGELVIQSGPGRGTEVRFSTPLKEDGEAM